MANGTATITIDTGEWVFVDKNGIEHTVTNGQTFDLESTDTGDGAIYTPTANQSVTTTDGYNITFRRDSAPHSRLTIAGDTAVTNDLKTLGDIVISFDGTGETSRWKCRSFDANDADALTEITEATFERVDDPMSTFTWTTVTSSFA